MKYKRKNEKSEIATRCKTLLRKATESEQKLVNEAFPKFENGSWTYVVLYGLLTVFLGVISWAAAWESHGGWFELVIYLLLPVLPACGLICSLREYLQVKRFVKQIQEGSYMVAQGTGVVRDVGKYSCFIEGFLGDQPLECVSYDDFIRSSSKIFMDFSLSNEFVTMDWNHHFLYVSTDKGAFVIAKGLNGKIFISNSFVDLKESIYYGSFEKFRTYLEQEVKE